MSAQPLAYIDAVLAAHLPAGTKVVAVFIARRVGRSGTAWPHLTTIAEGVAMSERNASNAIASLEACGWLVTERPSAADRARGKATHYTLAMPPEHRKPTSAVAPDDTGTTLPVQHTQPASGVKGPSTGSGLPSTGSLLPVLPGFTPSSDLKERERPDPRGSLAVATRRAFVAAYSAKHATPHGGPRGNHLASILDAAEADSDPMDFVESAVAGFFASKRMAELRPPHPMRFFAEDVSEWAAEGRRSRSPKALDPDEAYRQAKAKSDAENAAWRARTA